MDSKRRQRAWRYMLTAAVFIAFPLGAFIYLNIRDITRNADTVNLGSAAPFILRDVAGKHFGNKDLKGSVTVVADYTLGCLPGSDCPLASASSHRLTEASLWLSEHLTTEATADKKRTPVQLVALAPADAALPAAWRVIAERVEPGTLFPKDELRLLEPQPVPRLVIIDPTGVFRGVFPLDGTMEFATFTALMSKLSFNQYLDEYLSKRTFFGPRRETAAQQQPGSPDQTGKM